APAPGPLPASSSGATLDPGGGDHGHAVLLIGVAEHALDGERVPGLRGDVIDLHHGPPSRVLRPFHLAPWGWFPQTRSTTTGASEQVPDGRDPRCFRLRPFCGP